MNVARQWREVEIALTGPPVERPYLDVDVLVDFVHDSGETLDPPGVLGRGRHLAGPVRVAASLKVPGTGPYAAERPGPDRGPADRCAGRARRPSGVRARVRHRGAADPGRPVRGRLDLAGGRGHRLGDAVAGPARRRRDLRRRPAGQGLQRRAADDRAARHAGHRSAAPQRRRGLRRRLRRPARGPADDSSTRSTFATSIGSSASWSSTVSPRCSSRCSTASAGRAWTSPGPVVPPRSTRATADIWSPATALGRRSTWSARTAPAPSRRSRPAGGRSTAGTRTGSRPASTTGRTRPPTPTRPPTWLDFQWCQTGHQGDHVPDRVAHLWRNTPAEGGR